MPTKSQSRTQSAINELARIVGSRNPRVFGDWSPSQLGALGASLAGSRAASPCGILLRTQLASADSAPWVEALQAFGESGRVWVASPARVFETLRQAGLSTEIAEHLDVEPLDLRSVESPHSESEIREARLRLVRWAELERLAPKSSAFRFSQLLGGVRPKVYVFDDYNQYIGKDVTAAESCPSSQVFAPVGSADLQAGAWRYLADGSVVEFARLIGSHCGYLNNLAIACGIL